MSKLPPKAIDGGTFDIKVSKLQLFLVVLQEEMEVLPCDVLLLLKAGGRHHGLDAVLGLHLRQRAVGDLNERPAKGARRAAVIGTDANIQ